MSPIHIVALLMALCMGAWAPDGLLLHYALDEGAGAVARDDSGNRLDAAVGAAWAESPSGTALSLDG